MWFPEINFLRALRHKVSNTVKQSVTMTSGNVLEVEPPVFFHRFMQKNDVVKFIKLRDYKLSDSALS